MLNRSAKIASLGLAIAAVAMQSTPAPAQNNPAVPLGRDPGGVAIAVLTTGISYNDPAIAACLARDGEGEVIGYDFVDNDHRPWSATARTDTRGDELIRMVPCHKGIRIVPVRVDPAQPMSLGRALDFTSKTPARIVVAPFWSNRSADFLPFGSAADAFRNLLVLVPAGDERRNVDEMPVFPAAFARASKDWPELGNLVAIGAATGDANKFEPLTGSGTATVAVMVVEAGADKPSEPAPVTSPSIRAVIDAAWSLACSLDTRTTPRDSAELKARLFAIARTKRTREGAALLDPGCKKS